MSWRTRTCVSTAATGKSLRAAGTTSTLWCTRRRFKVEFGGSRPAAQSQQYRKGTFGQEPCQETQTCTLTAQSHSAESSVKKNSKYLNLTHVSFFHTSVCTRAGAQYINYVQSFYIFGIFDVDCSKLKFIFRYFVIL